MPQRRKDEVERRIRCAALELFAREGYATATMARIAREAQVATGNLYHYFPDKRALFDAVLPPVLPASLLRLLAARVRAAPGAARPRPHAGRTAYREAMEALLAFALRHRREVVFLLGQGEGSPHAGFAEVVVRRLERLAGEHFAGRRAERLVDPAARLTLGLVYRNLVRSMVAILERDLDDEAVRAAVAAYSRYHLAGLEELLAPTRGGGRTARPARRRR